MRWCNWTKKLIRRWDSERELPLQRHRTRSLLQNTIDSCINFATDRPGYVLERMFSKFSEITQCNGHYAVHGHLVWYQSKAHIWLSISDYLMLTYFLSCTVYTVSKLCLIIRQIFARERGVPHFHALAGCYPLPI